MKVNYYSLKDNVVGHFGWLVSAKNDEAIKRDARVLLSSDNIYSKSPGDFDLFKIGYLDDESGAFKSDLTFVCCLRALAPFDENMKGDENV